MMTNTTGDGCTGDWFYSVTTAAGTSYSGISQSPNSPFFESPYKKIDINEIKMPIQIDSLEKTIEISLADFFKALPPELMKQILDKITLDKSLESL